MAPKNTSNYGVLIGSSFNLKAENGNLWLTKSYRSGTMFCYNCGNRETLKAPANWVGAYIESQ